MQLKTDCKRLAQYFNVYRNCYLSTIAFQKLTKISKNRSEQILSPRNLMTYLNDKILFFDCFKS